MDLMVEKKALIVKGKPIVEAVSARLVSIALVSDFILSASWSILFSILTSRYTDIAIGNPTFCTSCMT